MVCSIDGWITAISTEADSTTEPTPGAEPAAARPSSVASA
jgi:hypothetical protein